MRIYNLLLSEDNGINFKKAPGNLAKEVTILFTTEWYIDNIWDANEVLTIFSGKIEGRNFLAKYRSEPSGYETMTYDPDEKWEGIWIDLMNDETMDRFCRYILTEVERSKFTKLHRVLL